MPPSLAIAIGLSFIISSDLSTIVDFSFASLVLWLRYREQEQRQRCKIRPTAEFKRIGNIKGFYLVYKA